MKTPRPTPRPSNDQLAMALDTGELRKMTPSERDQAVLRLAWLLMEAADFHREEDNHERI